MFAYFFLVQDPLLQEETSEKEEMNEKEETNGKEETITDENIVDLQQFVPVGGVYHIDVLRLPPQVKQINDWSMVEVSEAAASTPCSSLPSHP